MDSFKAIIAALGGPAALAGDLGLVGNKGILVHAWGRRDSIPAEWFAAVVRCADQKELPEISLELLSALAEKTRLTKLAAGTVRPGRDNGKRKLTNSDPRERAA